jgi:tetratricopeptide (TPR) repeat protein
MQKDLNKAVKLCKEAIEIFDINDNGTDVYYSNTACEIRRELYYLLAGIESVLKNKQDAQTILKRIWDVNRNIKIKRESYETFAQKRTFTKAEEYYEKIVYLGAKLDIIEMYAIRHINKQF